MGPLVSLARTIGRFGRNRIPPQLVVQITNRCNARCPQCGMRRSADIARFDLSGAVMARILDGCAERGVQAISFTGGEPLLRRDELVRWIDAAGKAGIPYIRTGTNGFLLCGADRSGFTERIQRLADRLAATPLRNFWISLDSAEPEVHERMRGLPGVVAGIARSLPIFHAAGIYPSANLGLNRYVGGALTQDLRPEGFGCRKDYLEAFYETYCAALDRFYHFVRDLGFTIVNTCYPMSIDAPEEAAGLSAVYAATALEDVVRYAADEKAMLYKALLDTIPRHRSQLRIFTPLSSLYMLQRTCAGAADPGEPFGCRGGVDFFFIDAHQGDTFPCGYRGHENMGKFWELDLNAIRPNGDCRRCDWECFRDPSELCAPLLQALHAPLQLAAKMIRDPRYRRLWIQDMRYYQACGLFDGRRPPDSARLQRFPRPN
jgi:MoaA/NifB/PqqE/SkfB family radical SAM enzyme